SFSSSHKKTSKLSNIILHQFEGLHKLWDTPAAGRFSDKFPFRRSAILPGGLYYFIGDFIEISYEIIKGSANPFDTLCIFDLQILFLFFYIFFTYFNHHNLPNKQDSHPSLFLFQILSSCYIMLK
ncbi:hypothetical protein, partial [Anaerostipes hadrus]|uniref:hypothetical protein n=1 Tax=Anaerostipes hadrus TaxID=649756 RepID=UPI000B23DD3A